MLQGPVNDSYLEITRPLLEFLRKSGVGASFRGECPSLKTANCFAGSACPDLVVGGKKVFGSAQRRKGGAVLTHGSLLLSINQELWNGVFGPRLGAGFASVDLGATDWAAVLKEIYGQALGLNWLESGVSLRG
jgi:lipoate-protein ligase A